MASTEGRGTGAGEGASGEAGRGEAGRGEAGCGAPAAGLSCGIINQPEPHYLFHRPMHVLLGSCFAAGFVVDGMEEPAFPPGMNAKSAFSWAKRPQIPPAMVVRVR